MNEHLRLLLELNYKAKEKVLISPVGQVVGLDGRTFNIDGAVVIANTITNGIDLVFDVDHGYGEYGGKAAGWFKFDSLEVREDGIYASLETTTLGNELIDGKLYRYVSPAYIMDRNKSDRTVLALDSVGLVNRPNLIKDALNSKDKEVIKELNSKIETLETERNQAVQTADTTSKELEETTSKLTETNSKLTKVESDLTQIKEQNKTFKIDLAVEQNRILPKDREFCKSLTDEQLDSYIQNNAGSALAKELGKNIKTKENNKSTFVDTAVKAGSR